MKIQIKELSPITRKDGTPVEGIGKNGKFYKLWKVMGKDPDQPEARQEEYSYVQFGEDCPIQEGNVYQFDVKEERRGNFINKTLVPQKNKGLEEKVVQLEGRVVQLEERVEQMKNWALKIEENLKQNGQSTQ